MKKCKRCGKLHQDDYIEICDACGFDFEEHKRIQKLFGEKEAPRAQQPSDLIDYPVLTFIIGLLSLVLPIYVFSFIALKLAKKPSKPSLQPFSNFGKILAILGLIVSTIVVGYIILKIIG